MPDTGFSPYALVAGFGMLLLPRPFAVVRRKSRIFMEAALGILPWIPGFGWCWLPFASWFCWALAEAAVFTGLRSENRSAALWGAVVGVVLGGLFYWVLGVEGSLLPICAAVLLMVPSWLRR